MEEERRGQINVQILIHAAMQGDYTPSELILSLTAKIRDRDELLSKACAFVDDKRDTVTHGQIQQIEGRRRREWRCVVQTTTTEPSNGVRGARQ